MNELDLYLENRFDVYYTEMKTREKYNKEKFKRKYEYDPKTKTVKGPDGRRIEVDIDVNNPKMKITNLKGETKEVPRETSTDVNSKNPRINFGKNVFKAKNFDRVDGIFLHEVDHGRDHSLVSSVNDGKSEYIGKKLIDDIFNNIKRKYIDDGFPESFVDSVLKGPEVSATKKDLLQKYLKGQITPETMRSKYRKTAYEKLEKMVPKNNKNSHVNAMEFEADLYAANKKGKETIKRALREASKFNRKDIKKKYGEKSERSKKFNALDSYDLKYRSKALDNNNLTNDEKNVYK